jgi:hypothetical protein
MYLLERVMRLYPERISGNPWPDTVPLKDYKVWDLVVDDSGNVINGPDLRVSGDHFAIVHRKHDLDCLLKNLPPKILRELAYYRKVRVDSDTCVERPREGRDDIVAISHDTKRKTSVYGANYLLGKEATEGAIHEFIADLSKFTELRPVVGAVAKRFMFDYISNNDAVRTDRIPQPVLRAFNTYGRGGNMDNLVVGTASYPEVKVDQRMSYLSAMARLYSPVPNIFHGIVWLDDSRYDPSDAFGIYCIDCDVSVSLMDTPVYREVGGTFIPVVGECKEVVVLKPTMDDLKWLESAGLAKVKRIHWAWRFAGRRVHPYRRLYEHMLQVREASRASAHFFKLVACALWGLTLQTYTEYDRDGKPHLVGGYWFNPVIGYTTTDLMRSINFRMKMKSEGKVSAEVVDMLTGPEGTWYDERVVKVKGPHLYTHVGTLYHLSPEDDRLGLLEEIRSCRGLRLKKRVPTRYSFSMMRLAETSRAVREWFGKVREVEVTIGSGTSKRKFPAEAGRVRLSELLRTKFEGRPMTEEEARSATPEVDWNAMLFELATGTILEKLMADGRAW